MRNALILAPLVLLAACGGNDGSSTTGNGTSITISGTDDNGQAVMATADGNKGEVAVNFPGFEGKLKVPKLQLDSDDVDIDGVHLYPGSAIDGIHIDASGKGPHKGKDKVNLTFTSPAPAATVRDWFQKKFADNGTAVKREGDRLTGTTKDDGSFELIVSPAGSDRSTGRLQMVE